MEKFILFFIMLVATIIITFIKSMGFTLLKRYLNFDISESKKDIIHLITAYIGVILISCLLALGVLI